MNGEVTTTIENGIATISFFHPQSNSLPGALLREIGNTIAAMGVDESVVLYI